MDGRIYVVQVEETKFCVSCAASDLTKLYIIILSIHS